MTFTDMRKVLSGYVYVIIDQTERRKLGFSKDADMRLDTLQIGNADILTVEHRLLVNDMKRAEDALHNLFAADRIRTNGEWFKITDMELFNKIFRVTQTDEREEQLLERLGLR